MFPREDKLSWASLEKNTKPTFDPRKVNGGFEPVVT